MNAPDRRSFLKLIGAPALAAVPLDFSRLLAIQAHRRTGTIEDVEHIVFLMQENRSFDHYFGTCLLYTSPSPRDRQKSRMPSSA